MPEKTDKKKLVFFYPKKASFINLDIAILSEKYEVIENTYSWTNKYLLPLNLIRQLFFILRKTRSSHFFVVSFGGYWSFLPARLGSLFGVPVFIMLHGTDCVGFEELKYGNMRKPILKWFLRSSYKRASKLLPVSKSLIYTENAYIIPGEIVKQGYKYYFPSNKTAVDVIHNAIDTEKWNINEQIKRSGNRFITVLSQGQFQIKGGELILELASRKPDLEFWFIGLNQPSHLSDIPINVKFIPRQSPAELLEHYNSAQYYFQLSLTEGFGCALVEAMSCGCVPIVSKVNILPDIVADAGFVLKERNIEALIHLIDSMEAKSPIDARKRVVGNYSVMMRSAKLFEALKA